MRRLLCTLLALGHVARADEPTASAPAPVQLSTRLARLPTPTCTGPLQQLRPGDPCAVTFRVATSAALVGLDHLLPIERRLVPIGPLGQASRRDAPPGTWVTGFSTDPQFVGIGSFDMRSR